MTLRSSILTFRINRFETTVIVAATLISVVVSAAVIGWMTSSGYRTCMSDDGTSFSTLCQGSFGQWMSRIARMSMTVVPIFPFAAGLLIGGPLIARELESGTARLAWSLSPSRIRWFAQRALPALALVAVAALAIGLTSEALFRTTNPSTNLDESFVGFRGRGILVALEALVIATVALALGSILGRMVPTFVLSLVLSAGIGVAIDKVESDLLLGEAAIGDSQTFMYNGGDLYLSNRFRLSDGTIATWEQLVAIHPEIEYQGFEEGPASGITSVTMYIPGSRYHDIERREALVLIGVAGLFATTATVVVLRRRPR